MRCCFCVDVAVVNDDVVFEDGDDDVDEDTIAEDFDELRDELERDERLLLLLCDVLNDCFDDGEEERRLEKRCNISCDAPSKFCRYCRAMRRDPRRFQDACRMRAKSVSICGGKFPACAVCVEEKRVELAVRPIDAMMVPRRSLREENRNIVRQCRGNKRGSIERECISQFVPMMRPHVYRPVTSTHRCATMCQVGMYLS